MSEEEIPEYLKKIQEKGPIKNRDDNFGPEDITTPDGFRDLQLQDMFVKYADANDVPLFLILASIVKSTQADLDTPEIISTVNKLLDIILKRQTRGNRVKSDDGLLREIGSLWATQAVFENRSEAEIVLRKIVRSVLDASDGFESQSTDSTIKRLERKFKKRRGALTSLPLLEGFRSEYRLQFDQFSRELTAFGVPSDSSVFDDL